MNTLHLILSSPELKSVFLSHRLFVCFLPLAPPTVGVGGWRWHWHRLDTDYPPTCLRIMKKDNKAQGDDMVRWREEKKMERVAGMEMKIE